MPDRGKDVQATLRGIGLLRAALTHRWDCACLRYAKPSHRGHVLQRRDAATVLLLDNRAVCRSAWVSAYLLSAVARRAAALHARL